jgi:sporulation protein YlmC with PRC-barrel domain
MELWLVSPGNTPLADLRHGDEGKTFIDAGRIVAIGEILVVAHIAVDWMC